MNVADRNNNPGRYCRTVTVFSVTLAVKEKHLYSFFVVLFCFLKAQTTAFAMFDSFLADMPQVETDRQGFFSDKNSDLVM